MIGAALFLALVAFLWFRMRARRAYKLTVTPLGGLDTGARFYRTPTGRRPRGF